MRSDWSDSKSGALRVDGGMTASDYTMQFLSDICGVEVERPKMLETTALGVAWLAGMKAELYPDRATFSQSWKADRRFTPNAINDGVYEKWKKAVTATISVH